MNKIGIVAAMVAAGGMLCAMPARAANGQEAEKLRRLDIMLMVTSLRCRTTRDDFQADFQRFEARHLGELNEANRTLRNGLVASHGVVGANRALDRLSTSMANQYGQGHPWLGCGELKMAARILGDLNDRKALVEAADQLLAPADRATFALAR